MAAMATLMAVAVLLGHAALSQAVRVSLSEEKDTLYLPISDALAEDRFEFDSGVGEQIAYDPVSRYAYAVVGNSPNHLAVTRNCKKILIAIDGHPVEEGPGDNPEGFVVLIEFRSRDLSQAFRKTAMDFREFDSRASDLEQDGLSYGDKTVPLRFDLTPEKICLGNKESRAFVTLEVRRAVVLKSST